MALQWDDLNFKTGVLNVNKQVYDVRGQLQISTPKTKNSVRKLVLPPAVVAVLQEYKKAVDSRWMFPSPVKEDCPITPGVVYGAGCSSFWSTQDASMCASMICVIRSQRWRWKTVWM